MYQSPSHLRAAGLESRSWYLAIERFADHQLQSLTPANTQHYSQLQKMAYSLMENSTDVTVVGVSSGVHTVSLKHTLLVPGKPAGETCM